MLKRSTCIISGFQANNPKTRFSQTPASNRIRTRFDRGSRLAEGRYIIERKIAQGACSDVYLADDTLKKRRVALKVFSNGRFAGSGSWDICRMEARLCDRVNSGCCVKLYDTHLCGHGGGEIFILSMEYLEGLTFRDWLEKNKDNQIRIDQGPGLFCGICRCVSDIHNSGLLHLDVKPENFLITDSGVKVIDFGTSAFVTAAREEPDTCMDQIPGTALYMAPEMFTVTYPDALSRAADIYSLGMILYETVSPRCRPPFDGSDQRLRMLHTNPGIGPEHLNRVDEKYRPLLQSCLHRDHLQRPGSVAELISELEKINPDTPRDKHPTESKSLLESIRRLSINTAANRALPAGGRLLFESLAGQGDCKQL
jgi:eukaryotic-like serine/threonine-protein kinase